MNKFNFNFNFFARAARKLIIISLLGVSLSALGAGDKLTVRAGQSGYLGELYPSTTRASVSYHPYWYGGTESITPGIDYPTLPRRAAYLQLSTVANHTIMHNFPLYNGAYGVRLVNENDKNRIIVLLINGTLNATYYRASGGFTSRFAVLKESVVTSGNLYEVGALRWAVEPNTAPIYNYFREGFGNNGSVSINVTSFSAYASSENGGPTTVVKGRYKLSENEVLEFGCAALYTWRGGCATSNSALLSDKTLSIEALDSCTVTPMTATNIVFGTQLAGRRTNQLLETRPASMAINCITTGKLLMVLSANQPLHGQGTAGTGAGTNFAGMALNALAGNTSDSTERPYIVTSRVAPTADICRNGNVNAIPYYDRIKLGDIATTNIQQNLYFNLCQNGDVKAGGYRGSIDVSFYLE